MSIVINKKLYEKVKKLADIKFKSKTGIYRSSWIVNTYKKLGGKYSGVKPKLSGLSRWYKEKWVNLYKPIKGGYSDCGRKIINNFSTKNNLNERYPLCRPTYRITSKTPKTYKELSKTSINKAKQEKTGTKYIKFT